MRHALGGALWLLLAWTAAAEDKPDQKAPSPRQQYQALLKDYQEAFNAFRQAYEKDLTLEERRKVIAEKLPNPAKTAAGMVELAEKNHKDPVALDAVIWVLTNETPGRTSGQADVQKRAFRLVQDHFLDSDRLGPVCLQLADDPEARAVLQAIRAKSPHKDVQAEAGIAQALFLDRQISLAEALKGQPEIVKEVEAMYDKAFVEDLRKADVAKLQEDAARTLSEVAEKYASAMKTDRLELSLRLLNQRGMAASEPFLRTLMEKDARDEVKGMACLTLGQILKEQADKKPDQAAELQKKAEAAFEEAEKKYATAKIRGGTVGAEAKTQLFALRHLAIGKPAPEVEGQDQDGQKFKLSDYWGKVVLLDFWSQS